MYGKKQQESLELQGALSLWLARYGGSLYTEERDGMEKTLKVVTQYAMGERR